MAALSVQVPYPVFYDRDGTPLDNGNIYIGVANLDAVTNQIQVYYDEALTITASQPLITSNGYVYRNGTPAQLYVNATNFSILVNDSKNLLVYNFPDGTGIEAIINATSVEYDPPFTGAVTSNYTVADKLSQTVSVKDFGATGDGTTDDTAAVQAADSYASSVRTRLLFPTGIYRLTDSITFASEVQMFDGSVLSCSDDSKAFIFSGGFIAGLNGCIDTDAFTQFVNVEAIYPQWFGANGDAVFTTGAINAGSNALTVNTGLTAGAYVIANGDTVFVAGAGTSGGVFSSTVLSGGGTANLTLSSNAVTSVSSRAVATQDNTIALRRFFASVKEGGSTAIYGASQPSIVGCTKLYMPAGIYCSFGTITMYSACVLEGEFSNTIGGTRLVQCNRTAPLINVLADNFNSAGATVNGGNGNNIFRNIGFSGSEIDDTQTNSPVIQFQYAWNIHSDTEFDHCLWQNTAGACISGGFATTGTISSGSTTLTMANGSVFRSGNVGGGKITIVGAGVAGANLNAYIVSGGGTNIVTISTAASTSVTSATVFPQSERFELKINDCEMDVCRAGFDFAGNSSGTLNINNLLAFWNIRGALRVFSVGEWNLLVNDSYFDGCGDPNNGTDATWRNAIVVDSEYEGSLLIDSCVFNKSENFGGRIAYKGEFFTLRNSQFTDLDSAFNVKFIEADATQVVIQNNSFRSSLLTSYTNARLLAMPYASLTLAKITDNTFENTNASSYENFIQSDNVLDACQIVGNTFEGNVTTTINANIVDRVNTIVLNQGYNPVQRYGSAAPSVGTWAVGDIIWDTAPTAGGTIGWVCTTAGTPGTWKTFGAITP